MTDYTNTHANSFSVLIHLASAPNAAFAALHNAMVRMKWYMLRVPQWRAAVMAALGGLSAVGGLGFNNTALLKHDRHRKHIYASKALRGRGPRSAGPD